MNLVEIIITGIDVDGQHVRKIWSPGLEPGTFMTGIEVRANGAPVVRHGFALHELGYHTICDEDRIRVVPK